MAHLIKTQFKDGNWFGAVLALAAICACSAEADSPPLDGSNGDTAGKPVGGAGTGTSFGGSSSVAGSSPVAGTFGSAGTPPSTAGNMSSAGTASGAGSGSMPLPPVGPPQTLPLPIDPLFAASGYMGDAVNGNATMTPLMEGGDTTCEAARAPGAPVGQCHIVNFTTFGTVPMLSWGGVYWQYPGNNWGTSPGVAVEAGATKIVFMARGEAGGEKVGFFAGGLGLDSVGHLPNNTYYDGFYLTGDGVNTKTLTTEWTEYTLDLTGKAYDKTGVLGGFGWGVGADGNTLPVKFYLDDIRWEK